MNTLELTADAKAILLLCGRFGPGDNDPSAAPLAPSEYNQVADWLVGRGMRPADLLALPADGPPSGTAPPIDWGRLAALLKRGAALAFAVEKWLNSGIWVLCRSDTAYPARLKQHLRKTAPPVLFGAGDLRLLTAGGLAIVGSRSASTEALAFAALVGRRCAQENLAVVSGGARGVDEAAMLGALAAGGKAIGVLADRLGATAVSGRFRDALRADRLALVSPYSPEAVFSVGNAMGRNKLIYGLADFALVVSSEHKKGGTWAGAEEELRRPHPIPVFVRLSADAPKGNRELLKLGARQFPDDALQGSLAAALAQPPQPGAAIKHPPPTDRSPLLPLADDAPAAGKATEP